MAENTVKEKTEIRFGGANYIKRSVVQFLRFVFRYAPFVDPDYRWVEDKSGRKIEISGFYPTKPSAIPEVIVRAAPVGIQEQFIYGVGQRIDYDNLKWSGRNRYSLSIGVRSYSVEETEKISELIFFIFENKRLVDTYCSHHKAYIDLNSIRFTGITAGTLPGTDRPLFVGTITMDCYLEWYDKELEEEVGRLAEVYIETQPIDPPSE